jgi:crotonobetainyl-CoA:carnitine CoA-transferase CaiB-like acyl-CoA transferase
MNRLSNTLPLAGVRVIEICHSIAGPYAGSILAQLGADVTKIEHPDKGDDARTWAPPFLQGTSAVFQAMNRDKRGIAVDLKNALDCSALRRLILEEADVVVQSLRPGAITKLGLGSVELIAAKPSLIYCNLGAFGSVGPMKDKPGYDPLMQARSGLMSLTGEDNGEPVRIGTSIIDMGSGMWVAIGVLAAINQRWATGKGCVVDTSLFETSIAWMSIHVAGYLADGALRKRYGSGNAEIVPHQAFRTTDGFVMVAAGNNNLFPKLATAVGLPGLVADPRFGGNVLRVQNRAALIPALQAAFGSRSTDEWLGILDAAGVPCAPLQNVDELIQDPQTQALGMIQETADASMALVGLPLSFNGERPPLRNRAPKTGEHNHDILQSHE